MSAGTLHPASGHLPPSAEKECDEMLTKEELAAKLKVTVRCIENFHNSNRNKKGNIS